MQKIIKVIFPLFLFIMLISTVAADIDWERWGKKQVTAIAQVNVWVRSSAPSGLFCTRGEQISVIREGQEVKVLEYIKAKCGVFFNYNYLKVQIIDPDEGQQNIGIVSAVNDDGSPLFEEVLEGGI